MQKNDKTFFDKVDEWPIRPTFISLVEKKNNSDASLDSDGEVSLNSDGIYNSDILKGFLAETLRDRAISSPLALYQIVPQGLTFNDPEKEIQTIKNDYYDSYFENILNGKQIIFIHSGKFCENKRCCLSFRVLDKGKACFCLDSRIALLYDSRLSNIHFDKDYSLYRETFQKIVDEYNFYNEHSGKFPYFPLEIAEIPEKNRLYVRYICPYSRFEEFFFPIIAEGRVIAVLMSGQHISQGTKHEDIFKDYKDFAAIANDVKVISEEEFCEKSDKILKRLQTINNRIEILESRIAERIQSAGKVYVSKTFLKVETDFREKIKSIDNRVSNQLDEFKTALNNALEKICSAFGNSDNGFIRIFANNSIINNGKEIKLHLIGDSSNSAHSDDYSFQIPQISNDVVQWKNKQILQYASPKIQEAINTDSASVLRILDTRPFIPQMTYILWEKDTIQNNKYGDWGNYIFYCETLERFYQTLLGQYAILNGILVTQTLENSIRISGHESAQMLIAISDVINHEFLEKKASQFTIDQLNQLQNKMEDVESMLYLLGGVYQRPAMIIQRTLPGKEWCNFSKLLRSMNDFFVGKAKKDNLQQITRKWDPELDKYGLKTNKNFFNQIIYNLIENAIKYGYRGSNIYINASYKQLQQELIISVISFGVGIPKTDQEKIFDLFYRTLLPEMQGIEGTGVGLFLSKNLCQLLGYEITCNSNWIENIHIPMRYYFDKQKNKSILLNKLKPNDKHLLETKISVKKTKEIVNKNVSWNFGAFEIEALISKKTYKNEFTIKIPVNNNFKLQ